MYGKNTQGEVSIPICTCTPYVRSLWEWLHHEEQWGRAACWTCPWKEGQISSKLSWALIEGRPFGLQQMHIPAGHKKKKEKRKKEKKNPDFRTYEKKLNINNKKTCPGALWPISDEPVQRATAGCSGHTVLPTVRNLRSYLLTWASTYVTWQIRDILSVCIN